MGNNVDVCRAHLAENKCIVHPLMLQQYREPTVLPIIVVVLAGHYAFRFSNILTSRIDTIFAPVESMITKETNKKIHSLISHSKVFTSLEICSVFHICC